MTSQPRIRYLLLCESAEVVEHRLSCYGIFEEMALASFPSDVNFHVVLGLDSISDDEDLEVQYRLTRPEGQSSLSPVIQLAKGTSDPSPVLLMPARMTFHTPGRYTLVVLVNGRRVGAPYEFWILQQEVEETEKSRGDLVTL